MDAYERQHREAIKQYGKEIRALYVDAIRSVSQYTDVGQLNSDGDFFFRGNPDVNRAVNRLLTALNRNVQGKILQSVYSEWDRAVERNNEVCERVFGETLRQLPPQYVQKYLSGNEQARQAFFNRRTNGLGLSEHVWNQQRQFKKELELSLQYSIAKGKSAGETAQDIQQYLNEPDRLYRRVRDEFGVLRLSKAAQAYNPGQGTYRSSYKNALRLARNETNFSYKKSNQLKYQQQDFTVAMEIRVSSNHDPEDDKGGVSCIDLQGKYPKTFDWTYKWHVNCLCMSLSVQKTKEEIKEDVRRILRGEKPLPASSSVNYVGDLPSNYVALATEYDEKFSRYTNYPRTFALNKPKELEQS